MAEADALARGQHAHHAAPRHQAPVQVEEAQLCARRRDAHDILRRQLGAAPAPRDAGLAPLFCGLYFGS